jgi:hypothetical protein
VLVDKRDKIEIILSALLAAVAGAVAIWMILF